MAAVASLHERDERRDDAVAVGESRDLRDLRGSSLSSSRSKSGSASAGATPLFGWQQLRLASSSLD